MPAVKPATKCSYLSPDKNDAGVFSVIVGLIEK